MISLDQRNRAFIFLPVAGVGTLVLSYLIIGREMNIVLYGAIGLCLLLVCFFSVRISLALLIFSMLLSPELIVGETTKREITLRVEDILLLVMTVGWMFRMAVFKDIGTVVKNPLNAPILAFSLVAVTSTLLGVSRGDVQLASGFLFTLKFIEYFFLYIIVVNYVQTERDANSLLMMILTVFGIICMYGLYQVIAGGDIAAPFEGQAGEKNTLSGYLVLVGAVAGGVTIHSDSAAEKRLLAVLIVVCLVVLLLSGSRSGWLAMTTASVLLFILAPRKDVFVMLVCALLLLFPLLVPASVQERWAFTFGEQTYHPGMQVNLFGLRLDTSTSARIFSAMNISGNFTKHALFGYGVTGYSFVDGQFLRVLIEMGLVGLGAFIWLFARLHRLIRLAMRRDDLPPRLRGMVVGFYAAFWALMAHALTANTFIIVRIAEPFWCLAGLTVVCMSLKTERQLSVSEDSVLPTPA